MKANMYTKAFPRMEFSPLRASDQKECRRCNICGGSFTAHSRFERYCQHCKRGDELLKFSDWLPELDETLTARLSA